MLSSVGLGSAQVRKARCTLVVSLVVAAFVAPRTSAQSLSYSLFERYIETLRDQAAMPGLSAGVVQDNQLIWSRGFGLADIEAAVPATIDTPYPINDISQTFASTLLLQRCFDEGHLRIDDRVLRWLPQYPEPTTTVDQLLRHAAPSGGFRYDPNRFGALTTVVEECARVDVHRYARIVVEEIFDRMAMTDTVPGEDLQNTRAPNRELFPSPKQNQYAAVLKRMAIPYKVDSRLRPARSTYELKTLSASTGIVSTVRDLARYDEAFNVGLLLLPQTQALAWTQTAGIPMGLGWFVQRYNNELVVWHFGVAKDAYSSLIVKIPARHVTMILLANSDGLGPQTMLTDGDINQSLFAKVFLRFALP